MKLSARGLRRIEEQIERAKALREADRPRAHATSPTQTCKTDPRLPSGDFIKPPSREQLMRQR